MRFEGFGPLFKAYALALRSKMASGDISGTEKALFTSTSMRRGVPIAMHDAFTNGRVFALADGMQDPRSPLASDGSDCPSYASYLKSYIDNVEDSNKTDEKKVKLAMEKYQAIKREASLQFELAEYRWKEALQRDPSMTFDMWVQKYGYDYTDACDERILAKNDYRRAKKSGSHDVQMQKDMMESALRSDHEVPGSNMPCALQDVSIKTTEASGIVPTDIVYRPLHLLPGFKYAGDDWLAKGIRDRDANHLSEMRINLADGFTGSWKELGFPDVNDREYVEGSSELTYILETVNKWEMVLRYTDMQAFDINRGLWNVSSFRTILPPLAKTAPQKLQSEVFLTTRVLLAYNADLVLRLPPEIFTVLFPKASDKAADNVKPDISGLAGPEAQLLQSLFQFFPFAKVYKEQWDGDNELHVRAGFNGLYPTVLSILARKV